MRASRVCFQNCGFAARRWGRAPRAENPRRGERQKRQQAAAGGGGRRRRRYADAGEEAVVAAAERGAPGSLTTATTATGRRTAEVPPPERGGHRAARGAASNSPSTKCAVEAHRERLALRRKIEVDADPRGRAAAPAELDALAECDRGATVEQRPVSGRAGSSPFASAR